MNKTIDALFRRLQYEKFAAFIALVVLFAASSVLSPYFLQVQNLLNHPNWGNVSTAVNALNIGQVTSVRAMRSMSVNLRISF